MATNGSRDVPLTLSVTAVGTDSLKALQSEVQALAKQGGDAAPEFEKLATEIGKLGAQAALVEELRTVGDEIARLKVVQAQAAEQSDLLTMGLIELRDKTATLTSVERDAKAALIDGQAALFAKRQELAVLKNETSNADKETSAYTQSVKALNNEIINGKASVRALGEEFRAAKADTAAAAAEEAAFAKAAVTAGREVAAAKSEIESRNTTLREAKSALAEAGLAAVDVASAEVHLAKSFMDSKVAIDAIKQSHTEATAAARAAAAEDERLAIIQLNASRELQAQAKAEADGIVRDYQRMQAAQTEAAAAARASSDAINNALGVVGVKSVAQLQSEITRVRTSLELLQSSGTLTGAELASAMQRGQSAINGLERDIRSATGQMTLADKAAQMFSGSVGQFAAGNLAANAVMYLGQKVQDLGKAFLDAVIQGDQMRRGLTAIYGDARIAQSQMEFLRKSSSDAGVAFGTLGGEFVKFSASMKSANIPMEQSNNLFRAVAQASATLGLGSEATAGALNALGQMASKGVVSMEELRQQLGDRLPGAIGLTAKGLGITESQLNALVTSGSLATRDFVVPFTKALQTMQGETEGIVPTFDRLKGVLSEISQGAGDAGWTSFLSGGLRILGGVVGTVALGFSTLTEMIGMVGRAMAALAAYMGGSKTAWEDYKKDVDAATERLTKQNDALNRLIDGNTAASTAATSHAVALNAAAASTNTAVQSTNDLSRSHQLVALSAKLNADSTLDISQKLVQYNTVAATALAQQVIQTDAYSKMAKATKLHGESLVALAQVEGNHTALINAQTAAADANVVAQEKLLNSHNEEVAILAGQVAMFQQAAVARKLTEDQIKAEGDALNKKLVTAQAEAEQAKQSAEAARNEAFSRKLAAEALRDNSASVAEYKANMDAATNTLREYTLLQQQGKKSDDDVKAARQELTRWTYLYRDALADSVTKIDTQTKAQSVNMQLSIAQAQAGQKHYEIMAAQARALGDTAMATYYDIQAKEQAIKVLELELKLKALEQQAALATIDLKRKEIDASTEEGQQKLRLLDIEVQMIKVKQAANDMQKEVIAGMQHEVDNLRMGVGVRAQSATTIAAESAARAQSTSAIYNQVSALEASNAAQERANAATQKAIDLENKRRGVDSQGFAADEKGNRIVAGGDLTTRTGVYNFLKSAGVTDDALAKKITNEFSDGQGNITYANNPGQQKYGGTTISQALLRAAEQFTFSANQPGNNATGTTNNTTNVATAPVAPTATASTAPMSTVNVNLTLGGVNATIPTTDAGAAALMNILKAAQLAGTGG